MSVEDARDPPRPLDWTRIDAWTEALVREDIAPIATVFTGNGTRPPRVIWRPRAEDMTSRQLRFLLEHWAKLAAEGLPHVRAIDPFALKPALGYIMLLDVIDGGKDLFYRLYGSTIAGISGFDMTGQHLTRHRTSPYVTEFAISAYRAVLRMRAPLYTERSPVGATQTVWWQRLALPFVDDAGAITRILAGTVPIATNGLVIRG